ncbi:MAG TPA: TonB-dependent receptor [Terriglobales bacterium]|nr:TonB-dependent receptor [Terriglobales bacterium]
MLLLCATAAFGASQNAVLYGTVYDAGGGAISGATVTLDNPAIGFSRTTTTASDGTYSFSEVPPASGYKLTATQGGKAIDIRGNITVNVGEESVIAPPLKAQATPTVVEKAATEMPVTTEKVSSAQSGTITDQQLRSLPLYNRNFLTLGTLTPNTHDSGAADPLGEASFSVAGNRSTANMFLVDGADNRASSSNQAVPFQVNDAIQEFSVISSNSNATYGAQGGVVNVVTKRGGNKWHGSAFGYFGSDAFDSEGPLSVYNGGTFDQAAARANNPDGTTLTIFPQYYNDYVAAATALGFCTSSIDPTGTTGTLPCGGGIGALTGGAATGENPLFNPAAVMAANNRFDRPWQSQQYGVNMGGPIVKDKAFFFGSYEGTHIDNPNPVFERVPSAFDRTYDPLGTGAYNFTNLDPNYTVASGLMSLFPAANVIGVPDALEFYQGEAENNLMVHNVLGRADWVQSSSDSWNLRWIGQWLDQIHDATLPAVGSYAGNGANRTAFNQNLNLSQTHVFSSTLLNNAHVGFSRFHLREKPQDENFDPTTIGLPPGPMMSFFLSGLDTQYSGAVNANVGGNGLFSGWLDNGPLAPTLDGFFPMARIGAPLYAPSDHEDWSVFAADTVSWTWGRHQFRFGGEYRHFINSVVDGGLARGMVLSGNIGQFTSASRNCNDLCTALSGGTTAFGGSFANENFIMGPSFDYAQHNGSPFEADLRSHQFSAFAEDTMRVTERVTVTLGVRWDLFTRPQEQQNRLWNFDPVANGLVGQGTTSVLNQTQDNCAGTGTITGYPITPASFGNINLWDCSPTGTDGGLDNNHYTNFSPHLGVAWDVTGDGKWVVRAGGGLFYDREPASYTSQLMYNRPTSLFVPDPSLNGVASQLPQGIYGSLYDPFAFAGDPGSFSYGNASLNPAYMVGQPQPFAQCVIEIGAPCQYLQSAVLAGAMYGRDPENDNNPKVWQLNGSLQHQFTNNIVGEVGYVGSFGYDLPVFFNQGFNNEWFCSSTLGACDNNSYAPVFMQTNQGESHYNSLFVRARVADWHGLRLNGTYTFSRAHDNASALVFPQIPQTMFQMGCGPQSVGMFNPFSCSGGGFNPAQSGGSLTALTTTGSTTGITTPYTIPQDPNNFLDDDWGRSDYQSDHRFVLDFTYDVPSLQKAWGWSKWLDYWQISGIATARSGQPYTIYSLVGGELSQRANATGAVATSTDPNGAINPSNLAIAALTCGPAIPDSGLGLFAADGTTGTSCNGNTERNAFTGPMFSTVNLAIQKNFPIGDEGMMLSFRSEFYNLFGAENLYNPISLLSTDGFSLNPDFGKIKSAHDPRQIQFGVRFTW